LIIVLVSLECRKNFVKVELKPRKGQRHLFELFLRLNSGLAKKRVAMARPFHFLKKLLIIILMLQKWKGAPKQA
jgi:hypothetical protein